jgi:rubrerythrin
MADFHIRDIYDIAYKMEEDGEKFYRSLSKKFENSEVAAMFDYLADEEVGHKKVFKQIFADVKTLPINETIPGEYQEFINAYVDDLVFNSENLDE